MPDEIPLTPAEAELEARLRAQAAAAAAELEGPADDELEAEEV